MLNPCHLDRSLRAFAKTQCRDPRIRWLRLYVVDQAEECRKLCTTPSTHFACLGSGRDAPFRSCLKTVRRGSCSCHCFVLVFAREIGSGFSPDIKPRHQNGLQPSGHALLARGHVPGARSLLKYFESIQTRAELLPVDLDETHKSPNSRFLRKPQISL